MRNRLCVVGSSQVSPGPSGPVVDWLVARASPEPVRPLPYVVDALEESIDRLGSVGQVNGFQGVCWFKALQNLGVPVDIDRNGPLWALSDGNRILKDFGMVQRCR